MMAFLLTFSRLFGHFAILLLLLHYLVADMTCPSEIVFAHHVCKRIHSQSLMRVLSSESHLYASFEFFYYHWSKCWIHPLCEFWVPPLLELRFQIFILPLLDLDSSSKFKIFYWHCWTWFEFRVSPLL